MINTNKYQYKLEFSVTIINKNKFNTIKEPGKIMYTASLSNFRVYILRPLTDIYFLINQDFGLNYIITSKQNKKVGWEGGGGEQDYKMQFY